MKRIFRYEIQEKDAGKTIETFLLEHEYTPTCIKSLKKAESLITVNGKWEFVNKLLHHPFCAGSLLHGGSGVRL